MAQEDDLEAVRTIVAALDGFTSDEQAHNDLAPSIFCPSFLPVISYLCFVLFTEQSRFAGL